MWLGECSKGQAVRKNVRWTLGNAVMAFFRNAGNHSLEDTASHVKRPVNPSETEV